MITRKDAISLYQGLAETAITKGAGDPEQGIQYLIREFQLPETMATQLRARLQRMGALATK